MRSVFPYLPHITHMVRLPHSTTRSGAGLLVVRWLIVLFSLSSLFFVANVSAQDGAVSTRELRVFAAASLMEPFREIGKQLELSYPGLQVVYNFGGSAALRMQLEQGAQADVFAAADVIQMEQAKKSNVVQGNPLIFANNRLTIIVPLDNPAQILTLCDLGKPGVKLDLAHANVPVGNYSRQTIAKVQASCGYDFEQRVLKNLVSEEENVKQVVTKVRLGEADAGIVYVSDVTAKVSTAVRTIVIDDAYNQVASYPIAITTAVQNRASADAFIAFVLSPEGQVLLRGHGFIPVRQ